MKKRTERARRTNGTGANLVQLAEPMLMGMATTRHDLLAWVHAHGLAALDEVFREDAVAVAGPKDRRTTPRGRTREGMGRIWRWRALQRLWGGYPSGAGRVRLRGGWAGATAPRRMLRALGGRASATWLAKEEPAES
jgi:hypothetical protein